MVLRNRGVIWLVDALPEKTLWKGLPFLFIHFCSRKNKLKNREPIFIRCTSIKRILEQKSP